MDHLDCFALKNFPARHRRAVIILSQHSPFSLCTHPNPISVRRRGHSRLWTLAQRGGVVGGKGNSEALLSAPRSGFQLMSHGARLTRHSPVGCSWRRQSSRIAVPMGITTTLLPVRHQFPRPFPDGQRFQGGSRLWDTHAPREAHPEKAKAPGHTPC